MTERAEAFTSLEQQLLTAVARQGAQALRQAQAEAEAQEAALAFEHLNASLHAQVETLVDVAPDAINHQPA
jgi:GAF domain-containing protein